MSKPNWGTIVAISLLAAIFWGIGMLGGYATGRASVHENYIQRVCK